MHTIKKIIAASLLGFCSLSFSQQTNRDTGTCLETKKFFDFLKKEYEEVPVLAGNYRGKLLSVWINTKTKTGTIVLTDSESGQSCLVAELTDTSIIDNKTRI